MMKNQFYEFIFILAISYILSSLLFGFYIFITGSPILDPGNKFLGIYFSVAISWLILRVGGEK